MPLRGCALTVPMRYAAARAFLPARRERWGILPRQKGTLSALSPAVALHLGEKCTMSLLACRAAGSTLLRRSVPSCNGPFHLARVQKIRSCWTKRGKHKGRMMIICNICRFTDVATEYVSSRFQDCHFEFESRILLKLRSGVLLAGDAISSQGVLSLQCYVFLPEFAMR